MVGKMRLLPGATGGNVTQRDGYDAGQAAAMTLPEFERWLLFQIAIYHNGPHKGLGGQCPAQAWKTAVSGHSPLLPACLDVEHLTRQFLPARQGRFARLPQESPARTIRGGRRRLRRHRAVPASSCRRGSEPFRLTAFKSCTAATGIRFWRPELANKSPCIMMSARCSGSMRRSMASS